MYNYIFLISFLRPQNIIEMKENMINIFEVQEQVQKIKVLCNDLKVKMVPLERCGAKVKEQH